MDNSIVIGIVSLIGAIHFSFAKNLIEKIEEKNRTTITAAKASAKIHLFIPISDAMAGLMFSSLISHLILILLQNTGLDKKKIFLVLLVFLVYLFSWYILYNTLLRIGNVVQHYKKKYRIKIICYEGSYVFMIIFHSILYFILYLFAGDICNYSVDLCRYITIMILVISTISLIGWILCLGIWQPLNNLEKYLKAK